MSGRARSRVTLVASLVALAFAAEAGCGARTTLAPFEARAATPDASAGVRNDGGRGATGGKGGTSGGVGGGSGSGGTAAGGTTFDAGFDAADASPDAPACESGS